MNPWHDFKLKDWVDLHLQSHAPIVVDPSTAFTHVTVQHYGGVDSFVFAFSFLGLFFFVMLRYHTCTYMGNIKERRSLKDTDLLEKMQSFRVLVFVFK